MVKIPNSEGKRPVRRVLLVDDEPDHLLALAAFLRKYVANVTCANDAQTALEIAQREDFDVAIVDLRMPHIDGLRLLQQFKQWQPQLVVIIVTAYPTPATRAAAQRFGAAAYLEKPFCPQALRDLVGQSFPAGEAEAVGHEAFSNRVRSSNA